MRIAIDLDGVCYEWERTARYMLREIRGYANVPAMNTPSKDWDHISSNIGSDDWRWLWNEGIKLGLFRYGHVTTGAIIGLRALLEDGHDLLVVTHRPRTAVPDTLAWLSYINIAFSEVHILSDGQPKSKVKADLLIDDKPSNIIDWIGKGRKAIIFDRPWNRLWATTGCTRALGWPQVVEQVRSIGAD